MAAQLRKTTMHDVAILSFFCLSVLPAAGYPLQHCLPTGTSLSDVVSTQFAKADPSGSLIRKLTVEERLIQLKARCEKGKLVDLNGKEIRFYRLIGCWGNPPADYREILHRQRTELEGLRERYTVIEMTCNPDGDIRQRH